jgi:hypothetical protein
LPQCGQGEFGNLGRGLARYQLADGVLDDVADDILGRVMDAAGLADFGLFLDFGLMAGSEADDYTGF